MSKTSPQSSSANFAKRSTLRLLLGGATATAAGCCCTLRSFPKAEINEEAETFAFNQVNGAFLAPLSINTRNNPRDCIDAHAHFFNASDVTVKGFIEGPVSHSSSGVIAELMKLLAPVADALGEIPPTAKEEYDNLQRVHSTRLSFTAEQHRAAMLEDRDKERQMISEEFNKLIQTKKGAPFRRRYEELMTQYQTQSFAQPEARTRIRKLDAGSLFNAMQNSEQEVDQSQLRTFAATDRSPYCEGVLGFVGYMLSARRHNLVTYQTQFTAQEHDTIGVTRTLGALVDFDRWLDCAPRSAHEDQMKLHAELSRRSNNYMLPIISYNPRTDVEEKGRSLELVVEAVRHHGFVGVKIYPPNGFQPWGNSSLPTSGKAPTGKQIDEALQRFWLKCLELNVPVLAHSGPSMGKDDAHDVMSQPLAWKQLLEANFWPAGSGPGVSLGHFGGDSSSKGHNWTSQFVTDVMANAQGSRVFADLAYWDKLERDVAGNQDHDAAKKRLADVLKQRLGPNELVADRVMYGSDWLMLSKEKNWPSYAKQLLMAVRDIDPAYEDRIFSGNAKKCFGVQSLRFS